MPGEFQSTPPHGGRLTFMDEAGLPFRFNPRPRTGGDRWGRAAQQQHRVSIHAPARGATFWTNHGNPDGNVSIHAPARGAT